MATAAVINDCPTTFSLQSQSSFGHCEECGRPVVHVAKRKSSHSCESVSSRRSSSAVSGWLPSALLGFLFGDKPIVRSTDRPRMARSDTISLAGPPRSLTFHEADDAKDRRSSIPGPTMPVGVSERQMRNSVA